MKSKPRILKESDQFNMDRWVWIGATAAGWVLTVAYSDEDFPLYRLITAFDTDGSRLDEYYHRKRN